MSQQVPRALPLRDLSNHIVNRSCAGPGAVGGTNVKKRLGVRLVPGGGTAGGGGSGLMIAAGASTERFEPESPNVVSRGCAC